MYLAKDKNGRIGRQIPGYDEVAVVDPADVAERRGNVYASSHSIEADQAYYSQKRKQATALARAEKLARIAKRKAEVIEFQNNQRKARQFQELAKVDPMNERLKAYFGKQMGQPQYERVERSVQSGGDVVQHSADFSSSGGNSEIVRAKDAPRTIEWRADFRQNERVGSILTRDGEFGPNVTDYDRYVNGTDVNESNVVEMPIAGGTMLGRYDGKHLSRNPNGMGFSWSDTWDKFTTGITSGIDKGIDKIAEGLPEQLAKELQDIISGGGDAHVDAATGQIVVTRPPTYPVASASAIPKWAIYTGIGLAGLGVLLIAVKTFKK